MENKNLILGILFVAILLFGCVQNEVETPDVVDDVTDETLDENEDESLNETENIEDEIPEELVNETDAVPEEDEIPELDDTEIIDELISQRCVYNDGTGEIIYLLKGDKVKMSSSTQGLVIEMVIDGETSIMYDKGGMMLMGMSDFSNCDWVKYDFNVIQAEMEAQGMASEDEDLMGDMINIDENVVCTDMAISDSEFEVGGNVCDGTDVMLNLISMANQYK